MRETFLTLKMHNHALPPSRRRPVAHNLQGVVDNMCSASHLDHHILKVSGHLLRAALGLIKKALPKPLDFGHQITRHYHALPAAPRGRPALRSNVVRTHRQVELWRHHPTA